MLMAETDLQKILVLVPWHGRIQAGHMSVVRKKSFIVGKGKGITCFTRREGFHARRKNKKRTCGVF
jgi:hypothetical protein